MRYPIICLSAAADHEHLIRAIYAANIGYQYNYFASVTNAIKSWRGGQIDDDDVLISPYIWARDGGIWCTNFSSEQWLTPIA